MINFDDILNDYRNNTSYLFVRYLAHDIDIENCVKEIEKQNRIFKRKLSQLLTAGINNTDTNKLSQAIRGASNDTNTNKE